MPIRPRLLSNQQPEPAALPPLSDGNDDAMRLLYKPQVVELVGLSFVSLWEMIRRGQFPAPRQIGSRSAWLRGEIVAWLQALPKREYLPAEAKRENRLAARHRARKRAGGAS